MFDFRLIPLDRITIMIHLHTCLKIFVYCVSVCNCINTTLVNDSVHMKACIHGFKLAGEHVIYRLAYVLHTYLISVLCPLFMFTGFFLSIFFFFFFLWFTSTKRNLLPKFSTPNNHVLLEVYKYIKNVNV